MDTWGIASGVMLFHFNKILVKFHNLFFEMHGRSYGQWFECYCETNGAGILSSENKTLAKEFQTHSDK